MSGSHQPKNGATTNCPQYYAVSSSTVPIRRPLAVVANGAYVYVSGAYEPRLKSAVVFVLDPSKAGPQRPVALLAGPASGLAQIQALAIGP